MSLPSVALMDALYLFKTGISPLLLSDSYLGLFGDLAVFLDNALEV